MEIRQFDEAGFKHITHEDEITYDSWLFKYNDDNDTTIRITNHNDGEHPCWYLKMQDDDGLYEVKSFKTLKELFDFMQI